jgi:hypothetical protein
MPYVYTKTQVAYAGHIYMLTFNIDYAAVRTEILLLSLSIS